VFDRVICPIRGTDCSVGSTRPHGSLGNLPLVVVGGAMRFKGFFK
jgi:hypothetical protein